MNRPLSTQLPADLPENWQAEQTVSPNGIDVGLTQKHGYNYQSKQINDAQKSVNALNEAFDNVQQNLPDVANVTTVADSDTVPVVETANKVTKKITFANLITAIITKLRNTFAALSHTHGNVTNDGKVGSVADRAVMTGTGGAMIAGTLPVAGGGTGATTAAGARTNLGITLANIGAAPTSHSHNASDINAGTLAIARGGTGVTDLNVNKLPRGSNTDSTWTIYLSPNGNDNNTGFSTDLSMKSIRAAIGKYGGLNRLHLMLAAGTYTDSTEVVISGNTYISITGIPATASSVVITHPLIFQSNDVKLLRVTFDLSASSSTYPAVTLRQSKYDIQECVFKGKTTVHAGINVSLGSTGYIVSCTFQSGIRGVEIGSGASMTALTCNIASVFEIGFNVNGGMLCSGGNTNSARTQFTMYNSAIIFNDGISLNAATNSVATAVLQ